MDMDRKIEPKKGIARFLKKKYLPYALAVFLLIFIVYLLFRDDVSTLRVNADTLSVSEVTAGKFNDYIRISGQVQPMITVQLSPLESGVVDSLFLEEGTVVHAGEPIIRLKNEGLDMQILNAEADLAEKENWLRNTMIDMEQQRLSVNQELLQLQIEVKRLLRLFNSQKSLYKEKLISKEEYLRAEEDYQLAEGRLKLVQERVVQDSLYRGVQIKQMKLSLHNMQLNMQMIRQRKKNLIVTAPIDGELGLLDVTLGQSVSSGMKIGQINQQNSYKIEAQIDEHYIDRVSAGLEAQFERQDEQYSVLLRKVYPEVRDGKFKADFKFKEEHPDRIRAGQTYYLNLQLGQPEESILIPRGTFYQKTGGRWIYAVTADGNKAMKREIRIGRQNPNYYEVLEGLEPGEKVITSGYDNFGDNECLILK